MEGDERLVDFHIQLPEATLLALSQRAALDGVSVGTYARKLLRIVARDALYGAILDERD